LSTPWHCAAPELRSKAHGAPELNEQGKLIQGYDPRKADGAFRNKPATF